MPAAYGTRSFLCTGGDSTLTGGEKLNLYYCKYRSSLSTRWHPVCQFCARQD